MKLLELDKHPIIEAFRQLPNDFGNDETHAYHLLLPPEYNIDLDHTDVLMFFFVEDVREPNIFTNYLHNDIRATREGSILILQGNQTEILQTTPCTTTAGFSFDMHEIDCNPFQPSPIPPLCNEIKVVVQHPDQCLQFITQRVRSQIVPALVQETQKYSYITDINKNNLRKVVDYIQEKLDRISVAVFDVISFQFIPTPYKIQTNMIIFYAVTSIFHSKLFKAYHEFMAEENATARTAIKTVARSVADLEKLTEAALHLNGLSQMTSAAHGVRMVKEFFEGVMNALPNSQSAAADDILPAVCEGISLSTQLTTHIASTFQYLADIWPSEGLDQKTTYMIITCAIAASHFTYSQPQQELPVPKTMTIQVDQQTEGMIQQLEDILSMI